MTNLEGLWAERSSYSKQQFPKVSQVVRADERPILPQAVRPALSCRGVGWRRAVCGSKWLGQTSCSVSARLKPMLLVSGEFRSLSEWWRHSILPLTVYLTFLILVSGLAGIIGFPVHWVGSYFMYVTVQFPCHFWPLLCSSKGSCLPLYLPWFHGFYL